MVGKHRRTLRAREPAERRATRAGLRILWIVGVAGLGTCAVLLLTGPLPSPLRSIADVVLVNVVYLCGAGLCWSARTQTASERRAWRLIAVAVAVSAAGNAYSALTAGSGVAVTSYWGDALYLAFYPIVDVAGVMLLRARMRVSAAVWLDGLVVGFAVAALAAAFLVTPLLRHGQALTAEVATNLAYPLADLSLLIVLVTAAGLVGLRRDIRLGVLGIGLVLNLAGDLIYLLQNLDGHQWAGGPGALLWPLAVMTAAVAARLPGDRVRRFAAMRDPVCDDAGAPWRMMAPPLGANLAALVVLVAGFVHPLPVGAAFLAAGCIALATARTALTVRELRALPAARREARTDALTGLTNRRGWFEGCTLLLADPHALPITVLLIDLDRFKAVNDTFGHEAGDRLLVGVAARLAAVMRRDDLLARLGGDEFVVVLPATPAEAGLQIAHRLHDVLTEHGDPAERPVSGTIGVTTSASPTMPAALLAAADRAMYQAKNLRSRIAVATPGPADGHRGRRPAAHLHDLSSRRRHA